MAGLYDLDASLKRMARAARTADQKRLLAGPLDREARVSAEATLAEVEDFYAIVTRTYVLLATTCASLITATEGHPRGKVRREEVDPRYS